MTRLFLYEKVRDSRQQDWILPFVAAQKAIEANKVENFFDRADCCLTVRFRSQSCQGAHPTEAIIDPATLATVQFAAVEPAIHPPKDGKFLDRPCNRNNPKDRYNSGDRHSHPDGLHSDTNTLPP